MVINSNEEDALQALRRACSRGKKGMFKGQEGHVLQS